MVRFVYKDPTTGEQRLVEATELEVQEPDTKPLKFTLSDGSLVHLRVTLSSVQMAKDEYDATGCPLYNCNFNLTWNIRNVPESTYRKDQAGKRGHGKEVA